MSPRYLIKVRGSSPVQSLDTEARTLSSSIFAVSYIFNRQFRLPFAACTPPSRKMHGISRHRRHGHRVTGIIPSETEKAPPRNGRAEVARVIKRIMIRARIPKEIRPRSPTRMQRDLPIKHGEIITILLRYREQSDERRVAEFLLSTFPNSD